MCVRLVLRRAGVAQPPSDPCIQSPCGANCEGRDPPVRVWLWGRVRKELFGVTVGSFPGSLAGNGLRGPAGPWARPTRAARRGGRCRRRQGRPSPIQRLPGLGAAAVGAIASQHRPAMTQDVVDVVAAAAAAAAAVFAAMPCPCSRVGRATVGSPRKACFLNTGKIRPFPFKIISNVRSWLETLF